jgi:hypothetical protein
MPGSSGQIASAVEAGVGVLAWLKAGIGLS